MNLNSTKFLLYNTMIIGVMVSISSNSWVSMWTGMEIGVLSFVPMLTQEKSSSDSPVKFFIIQSISSSMMIMSMMTMQYNYWLKFSLLQAMLIKMGSAPFHIWVISMIEGMEYISMFLMFTIMKVPGLIVLSMLNEKVQMWSILSMLVGSIMAINQSSMRKILAYSSIYNLGVMISCITENSIWVNYMILYSVMIFGLMKIMITMKINFINQMIMNEFEPLIKITMWISMMSMSGMPPMMGFMTKIMVLEKLMYKKEMLVSSLMMLSSMIVTFYYMRVTFMSIMMSSVINKWNIVYPNKMPMSIMLINTISTPVMLTLKTLI